MQIFPAKKNLNSAPFTMLVRADSSFLRWVVHSATANLRQSLRRASRQNLKIQERLLFDLQPVSHAAHKCERQDGMQFFRFWPLLASDCCPCDHIVTHLLISVACAPRCHPAGNYKTKYNGREAGKRAMHQLIFGVQFFFYNKAYELGADFYVAVYGKCKSCPIKVARSWNKIFLYGRSVN